MDTYYTQKWVGLRDKRLATLYYLGLLLVTSMLLVRLGWQQAYVEWDHEISGVVRPRLKAPAPAAHERERAYCAYAAGILPEGPVPAESEKRRSTRCETWDELDLQEASPAFGDGAIFIPTRVQERLQEQDAGGRKYVDVPGSWRVFFVAGTIRPLPRAPS